MDIFIYIVVHVYAPGPCMSCNFPELIKLLCKGEVGARTTPEVCYKLIMVTIGLPKSSVDNFWQPKVAIFGKVMQ